LKTLENIRLDEFFDAKARQNILNLEPARGTFVHKTILADGLVGYEPETLSTILALLEETNDPMFVDVGANIGLYSTLVAAIFGDRAKIVAFEPTPKLAAICSEIFTINNLNVDLRALALASEPGTADFYISPTDTSSSLREGFRKATDTIQVEVSTMDTEMLGNIRPRVVAKIDTESTEGDVIEGGQEWIKACRPWIICEVLYKLEDQRIPDFFKSIGYKFYHIGEDGLVEAELISGEQNYKFRDWLLAPEELQNHQRTRISKIRARLNNAPNRESGSSPNTEQGSVRSTTEIPLIVRESPQRDDDVSKLNQYLTEGYDKVQGWCWEYNWQPIQFLAQRQEELSNELGPIAEIGVYHGKFFIGLSLLKARSKYQHTAIDVFDMQEFSLAGDGSRIRVPSSISDAQLDKFRSNLKSNNIDPEEICIIRADSTNLLGREIERTVNNFAKYSFFSVDGCHEFTHAYNDINIAMELTDHTGVIFVDDYLHVRWPGAQEAVAKLMFGGAPKFVPLYYVHNKLAMCHVNLHSDYLNGLAAFLQEKHPQTGVRTVTRYGWKTLTIEPKPGTLVLSLA
tara:strand:- start:3319 stop:5031 length:1713 start_codon:yes stop_codon:yes gene_type:complete